jgi:hypothetical protein
VNIETAETLVTSFKLSSILTMATQTEINHIKGNTENRGIIIIIIIIIIVDILLLKLPTTTTTIFHSHNTSSRIMALGLTQPQNRNEYQEYFQRGKGGLCAGMTTL